MREIKFRAWDEQNKIMHNDFQFIKSGDSANDWIIFKSDKHECFDRWVNNPYFSQQMKIMQFTGLHDKNGKEICEGDIIAYEQMRIFESECFEVIFLEGAFKRKNKNYDLRDLTVFIDKIEIIGNIYENPELLK
jgi:uncharacterized phage protein (TIGR01671 family)